MWIGLHYLLMLPTRSDYKKIPVSLIATVYNEAASITDLLESYAASSVLAMEFIIVDAGSSDQTQTLIQAFAAAQPHLQIKLLVKPGVTRGAARNLAARQSQGEFLAMTDAGCRLDRDWLAELWRAAQTQASSVVGGFFLADARSPMEAATSPYFLQSGLHLRASNFIPTTRSLLINKELYLQVGGLREDIVLSEDYELMQRLRQQRIGWYFARQALVYWRPPADLLTFASKIFAFAHSDASLLLHRPKIASIYLRYLLFWLVEVWWGSVVLLLVLAAYALWSIAKNYQSAKAGWFYLPLLQIVSDLAVMIGTACGYVLAWQNRKAVF